MEEILKRTNVLVTQKQIDKIKRYSKNELGTTNFSGGVRKLIEDLEEQ